MIGNLKREEDNATSTRTPCGVASVPELVQRQSPQNTGTDHRNIHGKQSQTGSNSSAIRTVPEPGMRNYAPSRDELISLFNLVRAKHTTPAQTQKRTLVEGSQQAAKRFRDFQLNELEEGEIISPRFFRTPAYSGGQTPVGVPPVSAPIDARRQNIQHWSPQLSTSRSHSVFQKETGPLMVPSFLSADQRCALDLSKEANVPSPLSLNGSGIMHSAAHRIRQNRAEAIDSGGEPATENEELQGPNNENNHSGAANGCNDERESNSDIFRQQDQTFGNLKQKRKRVYRRGSFPSYSKGPSAFNIFCKEHHEHSPTGVISNIKEVSSMWGQLTGPEKEAYKQRAQQLKATQDPAEMTEKNRQKFISKQLKAITSICTTLGGAGIDIAAVGLDTQTGAPVICGGGGNLSQSFVLHESIQAQFMHYMGSTLNMAAPFQKPYVSINENGAGPANLREKVRDLFNLKYSQALGRKSSLSYKRITEGKIKMYGLPEGIELKNPASYGRKKLVKILEHADQLSIVVTPGGSPDTSPSGVASPTELRSPTDIPSPVKIAESTDSTEIVNLARIVSDSNYKPLLRDIPQKENDMSINTADSKKIVNSSEVAVEHEQV